MTDVLVHETQQQISGPTDFQYSLENLEHLQFTTDLYRCGHCSTDFELLEDMILHKLNDENCSLVFVPSQKLKGINIPRFVEGFLDVEDSGLKTAESQLHVAQQRTDLIPIDEPPVLAAESDAQNAQDNLAYFLQALPGSRSKVRSICNKCGNSYRDATILKTHLLTVHSEETPYNCDFENCSFACKTKASLERHIRRHTGEKPFVCESCGRSFRESGTLARHIKSKIPCTRKPEGRLKRYGLTSAPKKKSSSKPPVALQTPPKTLEILITKGQDFPDKQTACESARTMLPSATIAQEESLDSMKKVASYSLMQLLESSFKTPEKEAKTTSTLDKSNFVVVDASHAEVEVPLLDRMRYQVSNQLATSNLSCLVCKQKFKIADELSQHLQHHLEDYKFRCDKCYYVDKSYSGLSTHARVCHSKHATNAKMPENWTEVAATQLISLHNILEEKTQDSKRGGFFRCHVCLKKFSQKSYFKMHMSSHTGGAHFECDVCKRTFINKDSLQKHLITHSFDRSFSCPICSKLFKRPNHLKDHLRTHSDSKPYVCKICNRRFKWQCVLKVHETTHNKECLFCCETCGRQLRNKSSLIRHTKRHVQGSSSRVSTAELNNCTKIDAPCFKENANEASAAAASIATVDIPECQNAETYLLVLDDNSLVLEDGTCILENAIMQPEDILE